MLLRDGEDTQVPSDTWNPAGIWEAHLPRLQYKSKPYSALVPRGKGEKNGGSRVK